MIDSHCHLADKQFDSDLEEVIARAKEAGVTRMVTIADSLPEAEKCVELAEKYPELYCSVGVHPHHAKDWKRGDGQVLKDRVSGSKRVRAIGEIGLDYHYDHSPRSVQRGVFLEQLTLSRELALPAVVHCREAIADVKTIVKEVEPLQFVLHCCTEKWEDVQCREVIKQCPLEQMMIETDAPYLAPGKHRGKRNEPAFVGQVAELIAEIKDLPQAEVNARIEQNTVEFFGLSL
jgi:TatD DNase family protein